MKYGINLYLWADDMHEGLMPVLEKLKKIGYDGVEVPIFDLDQNKWKTWAKRLDDLGLERTANTVIAPIPLTQSMYSCPSTSRNRAPFAPTA